MLDEVKNELFINMFDERFVFFVIVPIVLSVLFLLAVDWRERRRLLREKRNR